LKKPEKYSIFMKKEVISKVIQNKGKGYAWATFDEF